ncbi:MAG: prolyl aminopeptidase [Aquisalinus sp.]|nr:prolyl aminopeptidase [Aquisalinus sp.]
MTKKYGLFPAIEPHHTGRLKVSTLHEVYYEVSGAPDGQPVVVCHGGPGGGTSPSMRRYFDPAKYRIILFDQRGCGRSTPHAELRENTTWHLIEDMERLRAHLDVEEWLVFGGSWGSTLALTYAQTHPARVSGLVLRGIFTLRQDEIDWFYQEGASWIFPDAWEKFIAPIPEGERNDLLTAYARRLTGDNRHDQIEAAKAWSVWEGSTVSLYPSMERMKSFATDHFALAFARIENHYFINKGFFEEDDHIFQNAGKLKGIPGVIVQGRYDVVTPMRTAWMLHKVWPDCELAIVPDAGHAASEPGIISALVAATEKFKQ